MSRTLLRLLYYPSSSVRYLGFSVCRSLISCNLLNY